MFGDFFGKIVTGARSALTSVANIWPRLTKRDKILLGVTGGATLWGMLLGGAFIKQALVAGGTMALGLYLLLGYSNGAINFVARYRVVFDIVLSVACLVLPIVLGATLGMAIVFANLFVSCALLLISHKAGTVETVVAEPELAGAPA